MLSLRYLLLRLLGFAAGKNYIKVFNQLWIICFNDNKN